MNTEYILQIICDSLKNASNPSIKVSSLLQSAKRVALLRKDTLNLWWIALEFCSGDNGELKKINETMKSKFSADIYKSLSIKYMELWINERKIDQMDSELRVQKTDNIWAASIYDIETKISSLGCPEDYLVDTTGMHTLDVYYTEQENQKGKIILNFQKTQLETIVNRIRTRIENYLMEAEQDVLMGNSRSRYFDTCKNLVETTLGSLDKKFNEYFSAIEVHIGKDTLVDYEEALLDIRRILLLFADVICPARSEPVECQDGKKRTLSQDKYLNRISFVLFQKGGKHTSIDLLNQNLSDLSTRLEKINELACKGVHDEIKPSEANQCIAQMYLILSDIIRILGL